MLILITVDMSTVQEILKDGESEVVEFKANPELATIGKVISSFLNSNGGTMLLGVEDGGSVKGVSNAVRRADDIYRYLITNIVPESPISVNVETLEGKDIVLIEVWPGPRKPYIFQGTIYNRRNTKTVQITSDELLTIIDSRQKSDLHWERATLLSLNISDLSISAIRETIKASADNNRGRIFKQTEIEGFLSYYGLLQNGDLTNAAVVSFGNSPAQYIPQSRVRLCVMSEGRTGSNFKVDRFLEANLFENIKQIQNFFVDNLSVDKRFDKVQWERSKGFMYPMDALNEGVLNALVHRDLSIPSGSVTIIIYEDKLEISNFGKLPDGLVVRDLKKAHQSIPQNPDIAHMCFLRGYMDRIGRGTLKIIEACKEAGLKEPKWTVENSMVKLTFYSSVARSTKRIEGVTKGVIEGVTKETARKIEGIIEGVTEGVTEGVKFRIEQIVQLLSTKEGLKTSEIELLLNIPAKSIERYVKQLKDKNIIEFKGAARTGGYFLTKEAAKRLNNE
jgi:ATP-dependent DNA helicase RecG